MKVVHSSYWEWSIKQSESPKDKSYKPVWSASAKWEMLYAVFAFVLANYLYRHPKESTPISPGISWTKDWTVGKGKLGRLVQFIWELLWNKKWPVEFSPCVLFAPTLNVDCALFGMNMLPALGLLQIKVKQSCGFGCNLDREQKACFSQLVIIMTHSNTV